MHIFYDFCKMKFLCMLPLFAPTFGTTQVCGKILKLPHSWNLPGEASEFLQDATRE